MAGPAVRLVRGDKLAAEEINRETCEVLGSTMNHLAESRGSDIGVSRYLRTNAEALSASAAAIYRQLLIEAPPLRVELKEPEAWFFGPPAKWVADDISGHAVSIDQLSEAQGRWALIAASMALRDHPLDYIPNDLDSYSHGWVGERPLLIVLDEPDAALHATAQRHAVSGLVDLAGTTAATVLCSTHSREFLNADGVLLRHVARNEEGHVIVHQLSAIDREHIDELGLDVADLFLLHRVILVVEGVHDQIVIDGLIGEQLQDARVIVVPMRGGPNMASVVDGFVIANFSDAPVIAALDNLHAREIGAFWEDLVAHADGGQGAFDEVVRDHFSNKRKAEEAFLIEFCRAAVAAGALGRFRVFGFSAPDIPMYLPVEVVAPGLGSWSDLYTEFETQKKILSFKPWLKKRYGVDIDDGKLRQGIAAMDVVPDEFVELADLARRLRAHDRT